MIINIGHRFLTTEFSYPKHRLGILVVLGTIIFGFAGELVFHSGRENRCLFLIRGKGFPSLYAQFHVPNYDLS